MQIERIKERVPAIQNAELSLSLRRQTARINLSVTKAPGLKTQEARVCWKDKSGDRLRGGQIVDERPAQFWELCIFAVLPMVLLSGHGKVVDLPPRTGFTKWHPGSCKSCLISINSGQYAQACIIYRKKSVAR